MRTLKLKHGGTMTCLSNIPEGNPNDYVIFTVMSFKCSGKYYTTEAYKIDGITGEELRHKDLSKDPDERSYGIHLYNDVIDALENRDFLTEMTLVVNCEHFFPSMIHPKECSDNGCG